MIQHAHASGVNRKSIEESLSGSRGQIDSQSTTPILTTHINDIIRSRKIMEKDGQSGATKEVDAEWTMYVPISVTLPPSLCRPMGLYYCDCQEPGGDKARCNHPFSEHRGG